MHCYMFGLGCSAFARHYLRNHFCFLLLRVLRCFSSPRSPSFRNGATLLAPGCPIRTFRDQGLFAPPPDFSQLITSFFASESHGHPPSALSYFPSFLLRGLPLRSPDSPRFALRNLFRSSCPACQ